MEKAIFVTILKNAKKLSSLKEYERLYLGNEFCENLIPSIKEVKETIKFCNENNLKFTFVTPYITNKSIELLKDIFIIISKEKPSSEIVINDYGILEIMKELRTRISGLAMPVYAVDLPGGGGKIPLTESYIQKISDTEVVFNDFSGKKYSYPVEAG